MGGLFVQPIYIAWPGLTRICIRINDNELDDLPLVTLQVYCMLVCS